MATKNGHSGPQFIRYFEPILLALQQLGGSARPTEATDQVARDLKVTDAERAVPNQNGRSRFDNAVAWARLYLAKAGYIDASKRGVWRLTDKGREQKTLSHADALAIFEGVRGGRTRSAASETQNNVVAILAEETAESGAFTGTHREEVLAILDHRFLHLHQTEREKRKNKGHAETGQYDQFWKYADGFFHF